MERINKQEGPQEPQIDLKAVRTFGSLIKNSTAPTCRFRWPIDCGTAINILAGFYEAEVNNRNMECTFDRHTINNIIRVAKFVTAPSPSFGLYIGGDYGRGKTIMLYAFRRAVNFLHDQGMLREVMGEQWKPHFEIFQAVDIVELAHDRKEFQRVCNLNMLGIDDLGVESKTVKDFGNQLEPMMRLLEYRYNRQLFTVVTSNLHPTEQSDKFGARLADRLAEMFHIVGFFAEKSYRRQYAEKK